VSIHVLSPNTLKTTPDLFTALEKRDRGMELASLAEPAEWMRAAEALIDEFVRAGHPFTADNVRARIGPPRHANAMGALFKRAVESGTLRRGPMVQSHRPTARGRWLPSYVGARS
jgi:hypothetical protein